jgi:hypothetical protein
LGIFLHDRQILVEHFCAIAPSQPHDDERRDQRRSRVREQDAVGGCAVTIAGDEAHVTN